jgi:putative ABC transport system permease protein
VSRLRTLLSRLSAILRSRQSDRDIDEEIASHLAEAQDEYIQQGLSPEDARCAAIRSFGGVTQTKDVYREVRSFIWVEDLRQDLGYAIRTVIKNPGFPIVVVLTLALGIGAATAIYSVVDTVLLQPLPFPRSDRLVRIVENFTGAVPGRVYQRGPTHQQFLEWRAHSTTLSDATAVTVTTRTVRTSEGTTRLWGAAVSANTFSLLGVSALLGRTLGPGDEQAPDVVVLDFDTWQRAFKADPNVIGRAIEFRSGGFPAPEASPRLLTVVGVLPAGFELPTEPADYYTLLASDPSRPSPQVTMLALVKPGVSAAAALDEATVLGEAIRGPRSANALPLTGPRFEVLPVKDQIVKPLAPALRVLLASAGVVLLIVCANVANLLLVRGTARQREVAVRLAVGASRGRIVRQILAECAVLASAGGFLGAALGAGGVLLVRQLATVEAPGLLRFGVGPSILPRAHEVGVNLQMLAIALTLATVTCLMFGLFPALHLSRTSHLQAMGTRGGGRERGETRARSALVVGQLALATILLIGAGLLVHSFVKITRLNKGFDPSHVLTFQLLFPDEYSLNRKVETIETLLGRLRASPRVEAAGFARHGILIREELVIGVFVPPTRTLDEMRNEPRKPRVRSVGAGFLTAMGVPIVHGREFDESDGPNAPPAIVINRTAAREYFGMPNPVGQTVDWHVGKGQTQVTIVGVAEDVRTESLTAPLYPEIFVNYRQFLSLAEYWGEPISRRNEMAIGVLSFAVRTRGDPAVTMPVVRQVLNGVDPGIGIDSMVPMERMVANSVTRERFYAVLLGLFASVAALLSAIGVYAVLAYAVVQRTQEIGVRMALGAQRERVLALVLRKGFIMGFVGITLGLAGAAAITRVLRGMLFGITPLDALTFLTVALVFALVTTIASYVPAWRAAKVDPLVALRSE